MRDVGGGRGVCAAGAGGHFFILKHPRVPVTSLHHLEAEEKKKSDVHCCFLFCFSIERYVPGSPVPVCTCRVEWSSWRGEGKLKSKMRDVAPGDSRACPSPRDERESQPHRLGTNMLWCEASCSRPSAMRRDVWCLRHAGARACARVYARALAPQNIHTTHLQRTPARRLRCPFRPSPRGSAP